MPEKIFNIFKDLFLRSEHADSLFSFSWSVFIQIFIVISIVLFIYMKYIKNTQAEKLIRGILFFIISAWIFSVVLFALELRILGNIAQYLLIGLLLSMVIVFQPELRKLLVHLGQTKLVSQNLFSFKNTVKDEQRALLVREITEAVKYCSRVKRGALIVLQKDDNQSFYNEIGTVINANVSAELILTIFFPNTPLHDGAMIIQDGKILAAGVLLPLTEDPKLSWRYGTRHRAAIGASEISDSSCIVVSEETGDISIAIDGILRKYDDIVKFKEDLEILLGKKNSEKHDNILFHNIFKFRKK